MSELTETQTFEFFLHGAKKAKSAAKELARLNSSGSWIKIRSVLGQIERNGTKLYNAKPQTEIDNLILASGIEKNQR